MTDFARVRAWIFESNNRQVLFASRIDSADLSGPETPEATEFVLPHLGPRKATLMLAPDWQVLRLLREADISGNWPLVSEESVAVLNELVEALQTFTMNDVPLAS